MKNKLFNKILNSVFIIVILFFIFPLVAYADEAAGYYCVDNNVGTAVKIVGFLIFLIKVSVPIIVIAAGTLDFYKAVVSNSHDALVSSGKAFLFRVVLGVLIFFLPSVILFFLGLAEKSEGSDISSSFKACTQCLLGAHDSSNCDFDDVEPPDPFSGDPNGGEVPSDSGNSSGGSSGGSQGGSSGGSQGGSPGDYYPPGSFYPPGGSQGGSSGGSSGDYYPPGSFTPPGGYYPPLNTPVSKTAEAIASEAERIFNDKDFIAKFTYYSPSQERSVTYRAQGYREAVTNSIPASGSYRADCNSFVGIVVKRATGLGGDPNDSSLELSEFTIAGPLKGKKVWSVRSYHRDNFEVVAGPLLLNQALAVAKRGDLLASNNGSDTHIQVYLGDNCVIGNTGGKGVVISKRCGSKIPHSGDHFTVIRIKS